MGTPTPIRFGRRAATAVALITAASGLAVPAAPSPAGAATVTFTATADARVESGDPAKNFGASSTLRTDGSPAAETFVQFKLAGLTGPVTKARLRLYATSTTKDGPAAMATSAGWTERGITWDNRPSAAGPHLADVGAISATGYVDFDVTAGVAGDGTYAFLLRSIVADGVDFKSKDTGSNRPVLVVETGAAPTTTTTRPPTTTTTSAPTTTTTRPPSTTTTLAPTTTTTTTTTTTIGDAPAPPAHDGPAFAPSADATVREASPTSPDGHGQLILADGSPEIESYLRFNVAGVTAPVEKAQIQLYVADKSSNGPSVFLTGTGWTEDNLTWNTRPPGAGTALSSLGSVTAGSWVTLDVTSEVHGNGELNFLLVADSTDGTDFRSREAASGRPRLILTLGSEEPPPPSSTTTTTLPPADTTPPQTVIDNVDVSVLVMTATFHASESGSTFACRIDNLSWHPCTSPLTQYGLMLGTHTLAVRATDRAGNTDSTPATRSFSITNSGGPTTNPRDALLAPSVGALWGMHYELPSSGASIEERKQIIRDLEAALGRGLAIDHYYEPWGDTFPTWREPFDLAEGRIPMISWSKPPRDVLEILDGSQDSYIQARARGVKALGEPVFIRWFWEMEGSRNFNVAISPQLYTAAWRHIHDIWQQEGATNVAWVWCPNASAFTNGKAQLFYPGDEYVDWVCGDGYNWWPDSGQDYDEFGDKFEAVNDWAASRGKPAMAGEWGAQQMEPGRRAEWFRQALIDTKARLHNLLALVYFSSVGSHDWTLESEPDAFAAFRDMGLDPYFNPCGVGVTCPEPQLEPVLSDVLVSPSGLRASML